MKHLNALTLVTSLIVAGTASADTLTLHIDNNGDAGKLFAAAYASEAAFDAGDMSAGTFAQATPGGTVLKFENLAAGTYGISVLHDLNGNEQMDRNLFGAPNEPFGFSNNPTIGFSAPKFDEFKFDYDGTETELKITLNGG